MSTSLFLWFSVFSFQFSVFGKINYQQQLYPEVQLILIRIHMVAQASRLCRRRLKSAATKIAL
jgi:hypothetical protein